MSKITFRADDELITRLEDFDASKSEIMREALREYLDTHAGDDPRTETTAADSRPSPPDEPDAESLDDLVADRVDALIADRLDSMIADRLGRKRQQPQGQDVNVNISLDAPLGDTAHATEERVTTGTTVSNEPPNDVSHSLDGSKTDNSEGDRQTRACSQCGEDVDSAHVYCPNCGEKASRRLFCDCGDEVRSDWAFCPGCGRRTPAADVLDGV